MFPELTRDDVFRLETPRLWLRWPAAADAAAIAAFAGRPEVAAMTASWTVGISAEEAAARIAETQKRNALGETLRLAICLKEEPAVAIGMVGIDQACGGRLELGYMISPEHWGRGFASEAVRAIAAAAFRLTRADAIEGIVRLDNIGSRRVLEKCGFAASCSSTCNTAMEGPVAAETYRLERAALALPFVA